MQGWNDVYEFVRGHLGLDTNNIEITQEELIEYFKNQTMHDFSIYVPFHEYSIIGPADLIDSRIHKYKIKLPEGCSPIAVRELYWIKEGREDSITSTQLYYRGYRTSSATNIDYLMWNKLTDMIQSSHSVKVQIYTAPDEVVLSEALARNALIKIECCHQTPQTIDPDMVRYFKELCVADAMIILGARRRKYQNLSVPSGTINLNGDTMYQEGIQKRNEILSNLNQESVPRFYVHFVN